MRIILTSPNRLFFVVTFCVFLIVVYLLHQLGDIQPSTVYTRVLPNYARQFKFENEIDTNRDLPLEHPKRLVEDKYERTLDSPRTLSGPTIPDDTGLLYIDPPDKPPRQNLPTVKPKNLQDLAIFGDETEDEMESERYEHVKVSVIKDTEKKIGGYESDSVLLKQPIGDSGHKDTFINLIVSQNMVQNSDQNSRQLNSNSQTLIQSSDISEDQQILAEEWRKLREQQHKLLEEKIRFQKEMGKFQKPGELQYQSHLPPADPRHWLGLNSSVVELRYPGILFSREYRTRKFIDLEKTPTADVEHPPIDIGNMTDAQAEDRFYQLLTMTHLDCGDIRRLGNTEDGGWDVCVVEPYFPKPGCIVYSFGINYDFTFDDGLAETFGCQVRTFDPSMKTGDHMHQPTVYFYQLGLGASNTVNNNGWKLETLASIMRKLGHLNKTVDILKLDIEFSEWACLHTMLKEGVLRNVKQLLMEAHTPEVYSVARDSSKEDFYMMYQVLYGLEVQGFRKYHFTYNPLGKYTSPRTGKHRSCCYELYFINVRFLAT